MGDSMHYLMLSLKPLFVEINYTKNGNLWCCLLIKNKGFR